MGRLTFLRTIGVFTLAVAALAAEKPTSKPTSKPKPGSTIKSGTKEQPVKALTNGGFEQGIIDWSNKTDNDMSHAVAEAAHTGKLGLRVTDADPAIGASLTSQYIEAEAGKSYVVTFWARTIEGKGAGVVLRFSDATGKSIKPPESATEDRQVIPPDQQEWAQFTLRANGPDGTARVRVVITSNKKDQVTADFDDFVLKPDTDK